MQLTDKQLNRIYLELWHQVQNERIENKDLGDTWFKENIDKQTASDIIDLFENNQWQSAIKQLNHLKANIKTYA